MAKCNQLTSLPFKGQTKLFDITYSKYEHILVSITSLRSSDLPVICAAT